MIFVLEPQPEGNGEANNHTSEALNKTLDHAMLVRTFIAHRTHQVHYSPPQNSLRMLHTILSKETRGLPALA